MGSYFALLAFSRAAENSDLRWTSLLVTVLGEKEFCCLARWYFALKGRSFRGKRGEPGRGGGLFSGPKHQGFAQCQCLT